MFFTYKYVDFFFFFFFFLFFSFLSFFFVFFRAEVLLLITKPPKLVGPQIKNIYILDTTNNNILKQNETQSACAESANRGVN